MFDCPPSLQSLPATIYAHPANGAPRSSQFSPAQVKVSQLKARPSSASECAGSPLYQWPVCNFNKPTELVSGSGDRRGGKRVVATEHKADAITTRVHYVYVQLLGPNLGLNRQLLTSSHRSPLVWPPRCVRSGGFRYFAYRLRRRRFCGTWPKITKTTLKTPLKIW